MKIKIHFYNLSIFKVMHLMVSLTLFIFCIIFTNIINFLYSKLSSSYFIIFEESSKFLIFLIYQVLIIIISKVDFIKLEISRIEKYIDYYQEKKRFLGIKRINYSDLAILRTFIFYSPLFFAFLYFPFILSLTPSLIKVFINLYELLKFGTVYIIKANLIILIGILFLTDLNSTLIYLIFAAKKSIIYIFSFLIATLYRFFQLYLSNSSSFDALHKPIFIFNLLFTFLLIFISIQQNIRGNVYVE